VEDRFLSSLVLLSTKQSISFATTSVHLGDSGFRVSCPAAILAVPNLSLIFITPRTPSLRNLDRRMSQQMDSTGYNSIYVPLPSQKRLLLLSPSLQFPLHDV
jgi:hypothetical protein